MKKQVNSIGCFLARASLARVGVLGMIFGALLGALASVALAQDSRLDSRAESKAESRTDSRVEPESRPLILVSVPPMIELVRSIAGDTIALQSVVPADVSPETYEPKPAQAYLFRQAVALVGVGMGYESALQKRLDMRESSSAESKQDSSKASMIYYNLTSSPAVRSTLEKLESSSLDSAATRSQNLAHLESSHAEHGAHAHDPHIWLSLTLAAPNAKAIHALLCELFPEHRELYTRNLAAFLSRLESLQQEFASSLVRKKGGAFLVVHPAFGYLAREFGLEEIALEEDGKEMRLKALGTLHARLKEHQVRTLFIQPQFDRDRARSIAGTLGLKVEILDPLQESWEGILREFLQKIAESVPDMKG